MLLCVSAENYQVFVPESAQVGKPVGKIKANDEDIGINAEIKYSILNPEGAGMFSISTDKDTREGVITLRKVSLSFLLVFAKASITAIIAHSRVRGFPEPLIISGWFFNYGYFWSCGLLENQFCQHFETLTVFNGEYTCITGDHVISVKIAMKIYTIITFLQHQFTLKCKKKSLIAFNGGHFKFTLTVCSSSPLFEQKI